METIQIELGLLIGTVIFFAGLYIKDELERNKRQKLLDSVPYKFTDSACFHQMLCNCQDEQQMKDLFERYKYR